MAAAADCATLRLPAAVRPLCPTPGQQAEGPDWLEHSAASPLYATALPPGTTRDALISALTTAVEHQQPLRVAASMAGDSLRLFAAARAQTEDVAPIARWQFQTRYPTYPQWVTLQHGNVITIGLQRRSFGPFFYYPLNPSYGGRARVDRPVAAFLRAYQLDGGYTPGPLYAVLVLAGLVGSVLALVRRPGGSPGSRLALACLLFTATAATVLLAPDVFQFSWRYQLPAVITLPAAGVLGVAAALSRRQAREQPPGKGLIAVLDVTWVPGLRSAPSAAQPVSPAVEPAPSGPPPPAPLP
jgi:hypothetical protein